MFDQMFPAEVFDTQREFIQVFEPPRDFVFWSTLVEEETKELRQAHDNDEGMEQIFKESADVIYVMCGFYNTLPIKSQGLLNDELNQKVQNRFQSAVGTLQEMIINYVIPQELLVAAFRLVHESNMSKLAEDGSVLRREDGKVLKGPNYQPPDMTGVVELWRQHIENMKEAGLLEEATNDEAGE